MLKYIFLYSFDHDSLFLDGCLLFESMGYHIFILFSFLHALWHAFFSLTPFGMDFFLSFFSIAHTPFWNMRTLEKETHVKKMNGVFIFWMEKHVFA
jgi:hypothetical protein